MTTSSWFFSLRRLRWVLILTGVFCLPIPAMDIGYKISMPEPATHYFHIQIDITDIQQDYIDLQLPAWSPGRYLILNFARNVIDFSAVSHEEALVTRKIDKQTWRIETKGLSRIHASYRVFGNNLSGELSLLDREQGFLDGASLYMYVVGHKDQPVTLEIVPPPGWNVLSSAGSPGQTRFQFPHYDRMVDELVQLGAFTVTSFNAAGTEYRVCVYTHTEQHLIPPLVEKVKSITDTAVQMFGPLDTPRYTYFFHFRPDSDESTAMEHLNGCQLTRIHSLSDTGFMMDLTLFVTAHELVHAWNIKRLRPKGLGPFDYTQEVYTELLWFVEGITNYLADLVLVRSGIWSRERFYEQLAERITSFRGSQGIYQRSPEEASFDIWLWPIDGSRETDWWNTWTSFYISGELIGMSMDLSMRRQTGNDKNFNLFFQEFYNRYYQQEPAESYYGPGKGYTTEDLLRTLEESTGSSWSAFYQDYIATPGDIPFETFLQTAGLELVPDNAFPPLPFTGLNLTSAKHQYPMGFKIDEHSPAEQCGLKAQDVILSLDDQDVSMFNFNRILTEQAQDREIRVKFMRGHQIRETTMQLDNSKKIIVYKIVETENPSPQALQIREDWLSLLNAPTSIEWNLHP